MIRWHRSWVLLLGIFFLSTEILGQEQNYIQVHFLYGSKPKREYRKSESKWFGGMLGGHVGIESDSNEVVNFLPKGKVHIFGKKNKKHSTYAVHTRESFWSILGGESVKIKKLTLIIPVSATQKIRLDSIHKAYLQETPYDYAFFGMRCGAATYDVLSQLKILKSHSRNRTVTKIFYPKKIRKKLLKLAKKNNWQVARHEGSNRRKWERD